jgi:uncharacterized protein YjaZ
MNLFEILNDEKLSNKISNNIDKILQSKTFWSNDEKVYQETIKKIHKEHLSINMTDTKFNQTFNI